MKHTIVHTDLSQPIYEELKRMIIDKELETGQKIVQEKIAADLGVSRTPLNKALNRLEQEMMVESIPRRGMYVKDIDLKEMLDVFNVREGLEAVAARLAAEIRDEKAIQKLKSILEPFINTKGEINIEEYRKADEQFHLELINASGNLVLEKMYFFNNLQDRIVQMGLVRPHEETLDEHIKIIDAIEKGNADIAAYESAMHIRRSSKIIEKLIVEAENIQE